VKKNQSSEGFNVDMAQFAEAVKRMAEAAGAAAPSDDVVEAMHHAMRPDGEIAQLLCAAGSQLVRTAIHLPAERRASEVESIRGAIFLAAREHGCEALTPQLWGVVVTQVLTSGFERLFQMMLESQSAVADLRATGQRDAAEELAHKLAELCEQHRERVNAVSAMLAADSFAACATVQLALDSKTRKNAEAKSGDLGQNWRAN
jgi:hypothetical protein